MDAIVAARDGRWAAFEVKLGGAAHIDKAAESLLKFSERIDANKSGPPAVLGVVVATGYGYVRKDGIAVIPTAALKS